MATSKPAEPGDKNWRAVYLLAVAIVAFAAWPTLFFPFGRDQGIHATIAFALSEGHVTYSDVYNIKPPLTTGVHLLSQTIFGHSMTAIRAMDLVFALLTALGLVAIVRRSGLPPSAGAFTAFGFTLIYHSQGYWTNSQTDGWAGFLVVAAVLAMMSGWSRATSRARLAHMGLAGAALGLAFSAKYTIGGAGILVFAPLFARSAGKFRVSDFFAVTLGGLVVLLALTLTMFAVGAFGPYIEIQQYILGYVGYDAVPAPITTQVLGILQFPVTRAVVLLGALAWLWGLRRGDATLLHAIIPLWLLAGGVSGLVQGKGFAYHFLPLVPPYALLVGLAGWRLVEMLERLGSRRTRLVAALVAALIAMPSDAVKRVIHGVAAFSEPSPVQTMRDVIEAGSDFDIHATLAFNEVLSRHRSPGDSLFVWGYETMLYFLQQEPPRYRYPYSWPFLVDFYDGRYGGDLLARLNANPPKHIVVQSQDSTPWVTGRDQSSKEYLDSFLPLSAFLRTQYRLVDSAPRFELWEIVE